MRTGKKASNPRPRFGKDVGDPRDALGMFNAMRRFVEHRGVTGSTTGALNNLERYLRDFIEWADARNVTHPAHVTLAVLERYQRWLYHYRKQDGAPLTITSQQAKLIPLKSFFKYLTRTGAIGANPAAEMEMPKRVRRLPRHVLSIDEVERVIALADTGTVLGLRDRAMMEVLYATGIRRMEIAGLEISDIDAERCVLMVREGKGRKDRLLPLGERALHWVQEYLDRSRPQMTWNKDDKTLFLGVEGLPLSMLWLSVCIGNYVKRAELGKKGGCHLFRHTMATLMLEGGADIRFIQAMLGHAKLETTQIYTHVAIKQLQLVHARTHPGAQRRVRGVEADSGAQDAQQRPHGDAGDAGDAASALLAALDAEAAEEAADL